MTVFQYIVGLFYKRGVLLYHYISFTIEVNINKNGYIRLLLYFYLSQSQAIKEFFALTTEKAAEAAFINKFKTLKA